jgi:hypothetical protein
MKRVAKTTTGSETKNRPGSQFVFFVEGFSLFIVIQLQTDVHKKLIEPIVE